MLHQGFGLVLAGVGNDDGLAAAEIKACQRVLVGHATGQAQGIRQRIRRVLVRPDAAAAKCRAERGVVDGNDCLQAGGLVLDENDVFVIAHLRMIENGTVVN